MGIVDLDWLPLLLTANANCEALLIQLSKDPAIQLLFMSTVAFAKITQKGTLQSGPEDVEGTPAVQGLWWPHAVRVFKTHCGIG